MSEQGASASRTQRWLGSLVIVLACFVVYAPSLDGGFVWDDDTHLLLNPVFQEDGLERIWFHPPQEINYWPVTFTTYWLEHQLWGFDPLGYRIVNLLLHAMAAIVLWAVLRALRVPLSWGVALCFAIHPVNVESVAWIAQRKNILSLLFCLISALLFLRFERNPRAPTYCASVGSFLLAMLSKGAAAPFPAVLLLLAWWRRNTVSRRDVWRSVPFFVVTLTTSLLELSTQVLVADDDIVRDDGFFSRLAGSGWVVWFYLGKVLWPANLTFVYPKWQIDTASVVTWLPLVAGIALLGWAWRARGGIGRPILVALLFFILMLSPVMGFFNIYYMRFSFVADHYQYLAMIGIVALVVAGGGSLMLDSLRVPRRVAAVLATVALLGLGTTTAALSATYRSAETLWRATLDKNPDAFLAHYNLAQQLQTESRLDEAVPHYEAALRLDPQHAESMNNLGKVFEDQGHTDRAIEQYRRSIATAPDYLDPENNLGVLLHRIGRHDEARSHFEAALRIDSNSGVVHFNYGRLLADTGDWTAALSHFRRAAASLPDVARVRNALDDARRHVAEPERH